VKKQWLWNSGLFLCLAIIAACAAGLPHPTDALVTEARRSDPSATIETLEEGRKLFIADCSGCHNLRRPTSRRPEEWPKIVERMARRAKIPTNDKERILEYLMAVSGADGPSK